MQTCQSAVLLFKHQHNLLCPHLKSSRVVGLQERSTDNKRSALSAEAFVTTPPQSPPRSSNTQWRPTPLFRGNQKMVSKIPFFIQLNIISVFAPLIERICSHYIHTYVLGPKRWEGSTGVDIPRISFSIKLKLYWTGQLWFPSHGFSPSKVNIPLEAVTNIKIPISLSNPLSTGVIETFYVVLTKYGTVIALTAPPGYFSVICLPVSSTTDTTQWCQRPNSSLIPPFLVCPTKQLSLN